MQPDGSEEPREVADRRHLGGAPAIATPPRLVDNAPLSPILCRNDLVGASPCQEPWVDVFDHAVELTPTAQP